MSEQPPSPEATTRKARHLRLTIHSWPIRDQPLNSLAILAAFVTLGVLVWWQTANLWLAAFSQVGLVVSSWRLWLPSQFELGPHGVVHTVGTGRRVIRWHEIGGLAVQPRGVLLLPRHDLAPIAVIHGLYLPANDQYDDLLSVIRAYLGASPDSNSAP